MSDQQQPRSASVVCAAQRVLEVDPARVWTLVADPARVGDWAAIETVGFRGTELPKTGHVVFVRTRRWQRRASARRVEVEQWEAGASYRCKLQPSRLIKAASFDVAIHPEVTSSGVATTVKLVQRMETSPVAAGVVRWYVDRRLQTTLDRIDKATR